MTLASFVEPREFLASDEVVLGAIAQGQLPATMDEEVVGDQQFREHTSAGRFVRVQRQFFCPAFANHL